MSFRSRSRSGLHPEMIDDPEYFLKNELSWLVHITPTSVESALQGFPLEARHSYRWLAGNIRSVYFATVSDTFERYPGTVHVRAELELNVLSITADCLSGATTCPFSPVPLKPCR